MCNNTLKNWLNSSYLTQNNQCYIEQIYLSFLKDPESIDISWRQIFSQLFNEHDFNNTLLSENKKIRNFKSVHDIKSDTFIKKIKTVDNIVYAKLLQLVNSFRIYGHQYASLDPLKLQQNTLSNNLLQLEKYNFTSQDFQKQFDTTCLSFPKNFMKIKEIHEFLKKIYCNTVGIEYMHILNTEIILWIQKNVESFMQPSFDIQKQRQFLKEIIAAENIEHYLGIKFPGAKRFSLEGCDVLIPMLKEIIRYSVHQHNIKEIFFGMAHRGRLNVLINIFGKNPQDLFNEFDNNYHISHRTGDVKYHQGFCSDITINGNIIHLVLLHNPSHLEIINPVIMGAVRARIDQLSHQSISTNVHNLQKTQNNNTILPIVIHGDAAFSAQGVVQETFNMSQTRGYKINGTIHIIINNQIGFTTSNIQDMRSTQHCTDIAKMVQAPIFHINADDVSAVINNTRIALNFRNQFQRDVIINLVCYRRHGHNESDEPKVTQPLMYKKINNHPTLVESYTDLLYKKGIIDANDKNHMVNTYFHILEKENCVLKKWQPIYKRSSICANHNIPLNKNICDNFIKDHQYLKQLAYKINDIPSNISLHPRVKKIYHERIEMAKNNRLFDWGGAEILAYASLLDQGVSIRISGEDVARGTFFHRHAIVYDQNTGEKYIPLMFIKKNQGAFYIWDSILSEEAALAFEYGYSNIAKNTLVIWEAQFGDFSNGAQIIIDQFISSSEQKWGQLCNLVMLLPHGYEGQGPEHSSARIERYLQLCADQNIQICIPSTPSQIYHLLRRQIIHEIDNINNSKKPLIIISPKSLLRHPMVTSSLNDLAYGKFQTIFDEIYNNQIFSHQVIRVIICTGKIYYDLLMERKNIKQNKIAIIRIEQLYPFPHIDLQKILTTYSHVKDFIWCQEEPKNQGAWCYIKNYFYTNISNIIINYIGRPAASAPAGGYLFVHQQQQKKIIYDALHFN